MVRRDSYVLVGFLMGLFLIGASWAYLTSEVGEYVGVGTGNSIKETVGNFYETSSVGQRIFIFSMIVLSFVIVFIAALLVLKRFRKKVVIFRKDYVFESGNDRSRTDLDILYAILKDKKSVNLEDIEMTFKIDSDIALGWSKILEDGDLAEIEYPRFGKPVLTLLDKKKVEEKKRKEEEKLDSEKEGEEGDEKKKEVKKKSGVKKTKKVKGKVSRSSVKSKSRVKKKKRSKK